MRQLVLIVLTALSGCSEKVWVYGYRERPNEDCFETVFQLDRTYWGDFYTNCPEDDPPTLLIGDDGMCYVFSQSGCRNGKINRDPFFEGNRCPDATDCCAALVNGDLPRCPDALGEPPEGEPVAH